DNDWIDADLSTEQGIEILINKIKDWGIPDIIVANVYLRSNSIKLKNINSSSVPLINNNLEHLFQLIPICIEEQRKNKFGRWIGISSMISKMGGPGQSIYSMQKSALESLFKTIAIEEGKNGITANTISPGIIESPGAKSNYPNELLDTFSKMNLIGRAGKEEDVASAVLFLASPISSYITGVDIPVCGGYNLSWGIQYALEGKLNL
ncbi:MAG: SDR family oxidoreductase, partial [Leptospiraceae bacterium]|nr:SDR family oxidoreductase [Leptospiraceae bacterium]